MNPKKQFTPEEDAYIIKHYSKRGFRDIAAGLGRDYGSVQPRIAILVKRGQLDPRKRFYNPRWTEAEVRRLEQMWGLKSDQEVARILGRSVVSCILKARRRGFNRKVNVLTLRELMDIFGLGGNHDKVRKWMTSGNLKARKSPYVQGPYRVWQVFAEDLELFIKDYPSDYDRRRIDKERYPFWRTLADRAAVPVPPGKHPRLYTPAEDRFILSHYSHMCMAELGARLGRSVGSIDHRIKRLRDAQHLGLMKRGAWRYWTYEEELYLIEHWGKAPIEELAKHVKHSVLGTVSKARALGIRWPRATKAPAPFQSEPQNWLDAA